MRLLLVASLAIIGPMPVTAAGWPVAQVTPPARYTLDGRTWRSLEREAEVANDVWIPIGRRGRVLLLTIVQRRRPTVARMAEPGTPRPAAAAGA